MGIRLTKFQTIGVNHTDSKFKQVIQRGANALLVLAVLVSVELVAPQSVQAQAGLRDALEKLDKNENGLIEPEEITPLARPYLERITRGRSRSRSLSEAIRIDRLQEQARVYHAIQNGVAGSDVRPQGKPNVKQFGADEDQPMVPGFGIGKIKYPYSKDDLDEAKSIMGRYDRDKDGYINRREASRSRWTHRDPFADDIDKDDRISVMELTQRYARRRLLRSDSNQLVQRYQRLGSEVAPSQKDERRKDDSNWWRRGGSSFWLTASIMGRFDTNKNGRLELQEALKLGIPASRIDLDKDGELSREEMFALVNKLQAEAGEMTEGLPSWFYETDADKDGQVALHEFAKLGRPLREFTQLDANDDGLLTSDEAAKSAAAVGGSYQNEKAQVLPPRRTIISEIDVSDDFLIGDLNVHLSVTHSHTGYLDAYLTSPSGQRIELFTEIGGSGDHFDQTTFDDQARYPVNRAKSPFKGSFIPEGLLKKEPGLNSFNGKTVKGVWQLVVRGTRSDRFGMLHSWGISVKPIEDGPIGAQPDAATTTPEQPSAAESQARPQSNGESSYKSKAESRGKSYPEDEKKSYDKKSYSESKKESRTDEKE